MLKNKRQRNQKGYGKIKSTEEWLDTEENSKIFKKSLKKQ